MDFNERFRVARGASVGAVLLGLGLSAAPASGLGAVVTSGPLTALDSAQDAGLGSATAGVTLAPHHAGTTMVLRVHGVDPAQVGRQFGAHLHVGPCVPGNGLAAGAHYNHDVATGQVDPVVDASTEVWLDFTVNPGGNATAVARVPFVPLPGGRSVVIHQDATDDHGLAGPRLACLPVTW